MYQDEVTSKQAGLIYRHSALKGIGFEVKTPPTRDSVKAMGAVTRGDNPKLHFRSVKYYNTESFLGFLNQLISRYKDRKVHLIVDNTPYQKGPKVREWLEGKENGIELHYLPPYSPELNAVEYVRKETRRKTTHNRFFKALPKLKERPFRRLNRFQGNPASLRSVLTSFA